MFFAFPGFDSEAFMVGVWCIFCPLCCRYPFNCVRQPVFTCKYLPSVFLGLALVGQGRPGMEDATNLS